MLHVHAVSVTEHDLLEQSVVTFWLGYSPITFGVFKEYMEENIMGLKQRNQQVSISREIFKFTLIVWVSNL